MADEHAVHLVRVSARAPGEERAGVRQGQSEAGRRRGGRRRRRGRRARSARGADREHRGLVRGGGASARAPHGAEDDEAPGGDPGASRL